VSGTSPVVVGPENGAADERKVVGCRVEDAHLLNSVEAFGFNPEGVYCKARAPKKFINEENIHHGRVLGGGLAVMVCSDGLILGEEHASRMLGPE
jgi:hypothetical protein